MKLEDLYKAIINKSVTNKLIIFKNTDSHFISDQYINEIANQHNLQKVVYDDLSYIKTFKSVFDSLSEDELQVCKLDKLDITNDIFLTCFNVIISCDSITKETEKIYKDFIVTIPKLENWQVEEFLLSELDGMSEENIITLSKYCKNDLYRAQLEVDRLKIFDPSARDVLFEKFKEDFIYDDLTYNTVFDFTSAVITKDINKIKYLYNDLKNLDSSPIGILALLYNNFRNIINVQCARAASAELCGMKPNQFWATKYSINHYTRDQLMHIFLTITDLDRKFKTGEVEVEYLLDYLLVDILSC